MTTHSGDGFLYCYNNMYRMLYIWGIITFRLHNQRDGGPKSTPLRVIYAFGVRLVLILGFVAGVSVKLSDAQMSQAMLSRMSPLMKIVFSWECLCCIVTYVELCVSLDTRRSRHIKLLASMQQLDTQVSAQFPHVNWRYHRTRAKYWYGSIVVSCSYFLVSLALMFDTMHCSCGYVSTVFVASTYALLTCTLGVMTFIHVALMDYLRIRFRLFMKLLEQLHKTADKSEHEELQRRLDQLVGFTKRCTQILNELNEVCGFVAAAGIFYDFSHMTCFLYMLCQKVLHHEPWDTQYAFISLHLAIHMYKVLITSAYGFLLQSDKRNCLHQVSSYAAHLGNKATSRVQVECFQYWRMQNKHSAIIGASLPCNIFLAYVVFNAMANYVIILVQLLFQFQVKDKQGSAIPIPKDVELLKPIGHITHLNEAL